MQRIEVEKNTTIPETVDWIKKLAAQGANDTRIKKIASNCIGNNTLECVFDKAYDLLLYVPTPDTEQQLRTVENMFRDGQGNCANYATLISAILQNLGIGHAFRTVSYSRPNEYEHIYIVTTDGTILDPVLGQQQDGTESRAKRPIKGKFNKEVKYKYKQDYYMPSLSVLNGCPQQRTTTPNVMGIISNPDQYSSLSRSKAVRVGFIKHRNKKPLGCADCDGNCGGK